MANEPSRETVAASLRLDGLCAEVAEILQVRLGSVGSNEISPPHDLLEALRLGNCLVLTGRPVEVVGPS